MYLRVPTYHCIEEQMKEQFANLLICLIVNCFHWLICFKPGRGCLQQLRQVGTAAPVQSHRYRPSCRSGQLSFEELGLDTRDKAKLSCKTFLSSKCVTLMRTFFDLKSLWAIDGFTPWPLFAPSSPDWQFSWGQDFKVLLLSQKKSKTNREGAPILWPSWGISWSGPELNVDRNISSLFLLKYWWSFDEKSGQGGGCSWGSQKTIIWYFSFHSMLVNINRWL